MVDAARRVGRSVGTVGEDDGVDVLRGGPQARRIFEVALDEVGAGQQALAPPGVADERGDGELVALGGGDDAAADPAGRPDDEHMVEWAAHAQSVPTRTSDLIARRSSIAA